MGVRSEFTDSTVLLVGGAGFVGSNLCRALLRQEPKQILIVDNLLSADISNLPAQPAVRFVQGSIADSHILSGLPSTIDYVFHLACYHGNQSSIANPQADHENTALVSLMLFDHLKDYEGLRKVVYAAAGCAAAEKTFGPVEATPEDAPLSLHHDSPYSISKLIGELYANYFFARFGLPVVRTRFQNVYGPGEILGAGRWRGTPHTVWRNVVPTFIWKSMKQEPLPLENGGIATRDFVYVDDIVAGLITCACSGKPGEAYNLASGVETSIGELAKTIDSITGNPTPVAIRPARDWDRSGRRFGATEKAKRELGFEARVPLREGLESTVAWTRANAETIEQCIGQHGESMRRCAAGSPS